MSRAKIGGGGGNSGGGVSDHLLLNNIGVKTHATLDSEVNINNEKVSNVEHPLVETAVPAGAIFTDNNSWRPVSSLQEVTDAGNSTTKSITAAAFYEV